jgi:hypothetical protein
VLESSDPVERRRQKARERYANMSEEKKEERRMKARENYHRMSEEKKEERRVKAREKYHGKSEETKVRQDYHGRKIDGRSNDMDPQCHFTPQNMIGTIVFFLILYAWTY